MIFLIAFLYALLTAAAYWFARRYAVLTRAFRLGYTFTVAPVLIGCGLLGLLAIDALFDLQSLIAAGEMADEAFAEEHPVLTVLLEIGGLPAQLSPFIAMLSFTPGALVGVLGWYWIARKLDRSTEWAAIQQAIEARAAEDREVERRFALVRAEVDATIRGPRGTDCPRCQKKLTFFNRAHGDNIRVCAACWRQLAHLGAASPILRKIRADVRAKRSEEATE